MRNLKLSIIAILSISFALASCTKDNDNPVGTTASLLQESTWKVTSFLEDGNDETNQFLGYRFTFKADGTVSVFTGGSTASGTWNTGANDSSNKLNLSFGSSPLNDLNEDWDIISKTTSMVSMSHISGGGGGNDILVIEKN
jgi:hypothetical protein